MLKRPVYNRMVRMQQGLNRVATRRLEKYAEQRTNLAQYMEKIIQNRFENERVRAYPSTRWKETFRDNPILRDTGLLYSRALFAVMGTYRIRGKIRWNINKLGLNYAQFVQQKRPFFWSPDARELKPANKFAMNVLARELRKTTRK